MTPAHRMRVPCRSYALLGVGSQLPSASSRGKTEVDEASSARSSLAPAAASTPEGLPCRYQGTPLPIPRGTPSLAAGSPLATNTSEILGSLLRWHETAATYRPVWDSQVDPTG